MSGVLSRLADSIIARKVFNHDADDKRSRCFDRYGYWIGQNLFMSNHDFESWADFYRAGVQDWYDEVRI